MSTTTYSDQSTERPGLMGWGLENQSHDGRMAAEKAAVEAMMNAQPACQFERPAKDVTQSALLDKALKLQESDGIEDGFAFHYLEASVWGVVLSWLAQTIGSCVASGGMRAVFGRTMAEIFLFGQPEEFFGTDKPDVNSASSLCIFAPFSYGEGRQIGGIDNGGDGSFCGSHIQGYMERGCLPCWATGLDKYTNQFPEPLQSESTYRKWGDSSYRNIRAQFRSIAGDFKLTESVQVTAADKAIELLTKHYKPMQICSSWGFAPKSQIPGTTFWIYTRSGQWPHNMTIYGFVKIRGNWYAVVKNSWGMNAHKNGDYFLVPAEDFGRWVLDAECRTIGELTLPESMPQV